ncbi:bifunctional 3'-5' exonuclease/ATP-dependent helicase WRN-like [Montipora capricornis]|uniref:bifunctional 3'-5' exonuclease/ATP-dependent helicase WRN-like n=1 Tax=Montipora capricornis TaxID=246305 RepID=UPI0035F19911
MSSVNPPNVSKVLKSPAFKGRVKAIVADEAHLVVDWRGNHGEETLVDILGPLLEELRSKRLDFPLTIVYGNLETISNCFVYFSRGLGGKQNEPLNAPKVARNRLFTQFHAQYPEHERQRIVDELVKGKSKLIIIFDTVAFGIGLDIDNKRRVIHIGVPFTIEEYFQEAGRAGRDRLPAKAHVFYNSYDISQGKKQLSEVMRNYVQSKKCKREIILNYFRFKVPKRNGPLHECCDFHEEQCDCDDCIIATFSTIFEESTFQCDLAVTTE